MSTPAKSVRMLCCEAAHETFVERIKARIRSGHLIEADIEHWDPILSNTDDETEAVWNFVVEEVAAVLDSARARGEWL